MKIELPIIPNSQAFDRSKVMILFVLGGPGVGKGTQCALLAKEYGFIHISAGDLLRAERSRPESPFAKIIEEYIREGLIIPQEITIALLIDAMHRAHHESSCIDKLNDVKMRFLIDGFPRHIPQAQMFEERVCEARAVIFFECTADVMVSRIMRRSISSQRIDDNAASIEKRLRTFEESTLPVKEFYHKRGILHSINCDGDVNSVYERTRNIISSLLH